MSHAALMILSPKHGSSTSAQRRNRAEQERKWKKARFIGNQPGRLGHTCRSPRAHINSILPQRLHAPKREKLLLNEIMHSRGIDEGRRDPKKLLARTTALAQNGILGIFSVCPFCSLALQWRFFSAVVFPFPVLPYRWLCNFPVSLLCLFSIPLVYSRETH